MAAIEKAGPTIKRTTEPIPIELQSITSADVSLLRFSCLHDPWASFDVSSLPSERKAACALNCAIV
jgi:hypothetical protein